MKRLEFWFLCFHKPAFNKAGYYLVDVSIVFNSKILYYIFGLSGNTNHYIITLFQNYFSFIYNYALTKAKSKDFMLFLPAITEDNYYG